MKFCTACGKYVPANHPRPTSQEHRDLWRCGGPRKS